VEKDNKKFRESGHMILLILFITCYLTANIVALRRIELGGLIAHANVIIYPLTYLLLIIYKEIYGNKKAISILNYSVLAVLFSSLLITISSVLPAQDNSLSLLFNYSIRSTVAMIVAFYLSQNINITLYNFLEYRNTLKFLISSIIAVTLDSIIYIVFSYIGVMSFNELVMMFTGQYALSVIICVVYSLIFWAMESNERKQAIVEQTNISLENKEVIESDEIKKETTPRKKTTKKETVTKKDNTKKETIKKDTVKKETTKKDAVTKNKSKEKSPSVKKKTVKKTTSTKKETKASTVKKEQ